MSEGRKASVATGSGAAASTGSAGKKTDNAGPATELSPTVSMWHAFLLRKVTQRVTSMAEAALGPYGLTMRHFGVLSSAAADPGVTQRMVGERLRIDRTTVVAISDDLEQAGLLERRRGVDRRTFALHLTDNGVARLETFKKLMSEVHAEFLAPLTPAEQTTLHDLLFKLASAG